ncbi:DUF4747 family protein [Fodinibius sp. Rm-B-1B1-1]|uniref:DUF4747 family protein n=1 Tax=Fodinibius alkaliphilus TaxID=3140241 RepID=UPI003159C88F
MSNQQEVHFFVFNIRLLTDRERMPATYTRLFHTLHWLRKPEPIRKSRCYMMLASMEECYIAGTPVLKGYLGKFCEEHSHQWYDFNPCEAEKQSGAQIPCPNFRVIEYLFIPALHRFCLLMRLDKLSLSMVGKFLKAELNRAARKDEEVHVTLEKSPKFLEDIFSARDILDITFHVSFSNQDLNDEYTTLVDNQLRDAEVEHLEIRGRARDGKSVDLKKSEFLMGAAGLVPSNGRASVQIVNGKGEKKTVDTSNYPRIFQIRCGEGEKAAAVVHHMMKTYGRRNEV